ncbi:MAG: TonB-dependent receptor, partial [Proteobacteria bacterium]|nr:TonB-dependent receptor [Pseudomonadota bacterium]
KLSGIARWSGGEADGSWSLTALAYRNLWNATDQIPDRAIAGEADPVGAPAPPTADLISRFGQIDPSDGGITSRYSLSGEWRRAAGNSRQQVSVYGLYYDLDLFSDFTFLLDDPVHGDQIEQQDKRYVVGGQASQTWMGLLVGDATVGVQARSDLIHNGLYHTQARVRLDPTTADRISETTMGAFADLRTPWTPWFRTVIGLRGDAFWMNVDSLAGGGSGRASAQALSPKLDLIFGPWRRTELYLNYGQGFHSNDARGVVAAVDPASALPKSQGGEIGLRTTVLPHLRSEVSVWRLDLKSELVWDGDAGTNAPSGPTRRYGVEFANWWTPTMPGRTPASPTASPTGPMCPRPWSPPSTAAWRYTTRRGG